MDGRAPDSLGAAIATAVERIGKLQEAFLAVRSLRGSALAVEWSELKEDLSDKEQNLRQRYEQLVAMERDFEARSREIQGNIAKRDAEISDKEDALNQKDRDLAVVEAVENQQQQGKEPGIQPMDTDIVVDYSPAKIPPLKDSSSCDAGNASQDKAAEVRVRPYLKSLCENMDGEGLRKYVIDHKKDMGALRIEMPSALQHASDPARLVLDAIQGYYHPPELDSSSNEVGSSAPANRRACILLLEALSSVLGVDHPEVPLDIKFLVREVAQQWKSNMDIQDGPEGNSLDAQAFLQLLVAYGLSSEYDEEELCKLVLAVARRKQSPALCKALNLSHKIPEIVDHLAADGKQIEALAFAHAFDMMDRLEPVSLLKTYLKDARRNVHNKPGNGPKGQTFPCSLPQVDAVTKELTAVKNVIKCIEDYRLEDDYPSSPLHKRVVLLERTKSERKRTGGSVKGQAKRPRNGGYDRNYFNRPADKFQVFSEVPYSLAPAPAYDARLPATYSTYAPAGVANGRSRTPAGGSYVYSVDGSIYSSNIYGTQSPAPYTSYQIAPGLPPPPPTYQTTFMH
ncbi:hypothetical protein SELMODRAFT_123480 [Selaginella moellendorffii]|uniref:FRIGIDA-like protein n=1 Tax=Selaginella moellendorffii TaxID=88036 RepID=D8SRQ8_SELML|nr:hypothetical protein SELMODRAFT_123480 [Selaginella moellendorffii]